MVVLVLLMLAILAVAGAVVVYVAYPHRGEQVPGAPWLGDALQRGVGTVRTQAEPPAGETGGAREPQHADR